MQTSQEAASFADKQQVWRPDDEFLSQSEAQAWLGGISRTTLWRWARDGVGPVPVRLGPRKLGYRLGELRRFAAEREGATRHG
jgi:predicted DNA-binding transcriptional regulator AlpA